MATLGPYRFWLGRSGRLHDLVGLSSETPWDLTGFGWVGLVNLSCVPKVMHIQAS